MTAYTHPFIDVACVIIKAFNFMGVSDDFTETLTQRIQKIAQREGLTAEELLQTLLDVYEQQHAESDPIEDFIGAFDDDVSDLSVTVRRTLRQKFDS